MTILFVVFIFISAWASVGWLQPDEHARVIEPAHQLVYGYATLPWEFAIKKPLVSYLLAFIHTPVLLATKPFHLSGLDEAIFLRFFAGLICATKILAMVWLLRAFNFTGRSLTFLALLFALGPYGPVMLVRTSQENYGVTALMWSLAIFLRFKDHKNYLSAFFLSGFLLALAVSFRLQIGIAALFLGFYVLKILFDRRAFAFCLGCLLGFIPLALVDYFTYGTPFLPAWNYFTYALSDEDGAVAWGTEDWFWYFKEYFTSWFPPLSPFLLILLAQGLKSSFVLQILIIPYLAVHVLLLGHKEMRYMAPIFPWLFIATAIGFYRFSYKGEKFAVLFQRKLLGSKFWRITMYSLLGVYFTVGIVGGLITLNSSPNMYNAVGNLYRRGEAPQGFLYVGNTASGVSEFYTKVDDMPFRQISTDDYLAKLSQKEWNPNGPKLHAFYALHSEELDQATKTCELYYFAGSLWLREFFRYLPKGIQKPRYHGILKCPGSV